MSDSRYSYDENAEVWPYFALTLVGVVLVPATIVSIKTLLQSEDEEHGNSKRLKNMKFKPENHLEIEQFKLKQKSSSLFNTRNILIIIGWTIVAALIYIIHNQQSADTDQVIFDPYEILGVSFSATERQIKSTYRKLSLQYHPDKIRQLSDNQTRETIEARYVDITKAYKALTDETTRQNFLKYGHPDGPQQTSHGIALPNFLVEGKGSPVVVTFYAIFVGIILPYIVGSWWSGARMYTKTGIHQETASMFFETVAKQQPHLITYDLILDVLSKASEFQLLLPGKSVSDIKKLTDDHLHRRVTSNDEKSKFIVVSKSVKLLAGFLDVASAFKDSGVCRRIIEVQRCIIQAVPIDQRSKGDFLQLPGVKLINSMNEDAKFMKKHTIPKLHLLKAFLRVPGEEGIIPPSSQAHLVIKYIVLSDGVKVPDAEKLLANDPEEEESNTTKVLQDPLLTNNHPPQVPNVYAPYFPTFFRPSWYGFLISERENKIVDGPAELSRVDLDNLSLSDDDLGDITKLKIGTFKMQMTTATPPFPGTFMFKFALISTGYFGCDINESFTVTVENPPPVEEVQENDEISDPEEDSIAGAMAQLKGAKVKKVQEPESSDEEEEEEDLSDIDTDTEDEAEEKK